MEVLRLRERILVRIPDLVLPADSDRVLLTVDSLGSVDEEFSAADGSAAEFSAEFRCLEMLRLRERILVRILDLLLPVDSDCLFSVDSSGLAEDEFSAVDGSGEFSAVDGSAVARESRLLADVASSPIIGDL